MRTLSTPTFFAVPIESKPASSKDILEKANHIVKNRGVSIRKVDVYKEIFCCSPTKNPTTEREGL